ncbi:hypothetical protein P171DRAFT_484536 [Karstenula rhodostoma CBS 690.94]|uniref:Transcription factor TFIIIC triple barrel domain-containing protein n=1 Tax=Karstenula rhodostoma CBS 690.94 TaxID=1392251 RepID=A0A9P4UE62_9PLEO|nr:hypothetical protein P171DRAFT_484536 [Karstenula rhodostoma CBS 690.94]
MAQADEDEWEYEYDDHETEYFYIPIDLANVPSVQGALGLGGPTQKGHPTLLATKLRAITTERRETERSLAVQNVEGVDESVGRIQIIGLHTENPLMMYNDQLLSCEWNKTIGTDFIFAKPGAVVEEDDKVLRCLPSVDLVAMGSAKLVARIARMRPRDDLFEEDPKVGAQSSAEVMDTSGTDEPVAIPYKADGVASAPASTEAQSTKPTSSSFLGQLNALKARRGEASRLALSTATDGLRLVAAEEGATTTNTADEDTAMGGTTYIRIYWQQLILPQIVLAVLPMLPAQDTTMAEVMDFLEQRDVCWLPRGTTHEYLPSREHDVAPLYPSLVYAIKDLPETEAFGTVVEFIAIQLLASCYTVLPASSADNLPIGQQRMGSRVITALRLHTLHRLAPAAGHHARVNTETSPWPGLYSWLSREDVLAESVSRRRRRAVDAPGDECYTFMQGSIANEQADRLEPYSLKGIFFPDSRDTANFCFDYQPNIWSNCGTSATEVKERAVCGRTDDILQM